MAIGRLIERLFVQVRADMSDLSRDLQQGVAQTQSATRTMSMSWKQVSTQVDQLTRNLAQGKIAQSTYTSQMNRLATTMKGVAGSYQLAQKQVWGYASAARAAMVASEPVFNTRPVQAFTRSTGQARMQMMNLGFQINDIGQTLATGMNPMTVMIQQGSQIIQIYGGQGGVRAAFSDISRILGTLARRLWPLAAIAAAFKGMQTEINKTSDVTVTFGDTFRAVFQVLLGYIQGPVTRVFETLAPIWARVWQTIINITKSVGNTIIRTIAVTVAALKTPIDQIPELFIAAFNSAVSVAADKMATLLTIVQFFAQRAANVFNRIFGSDIEITALDEGIERLQEAADTFGRAAGISLGQMGEETRRNIEEALNRDFLGEFFDDVRTQAIENAMARVREDIEKTGGSMEDLGEETRDLLEEMKNGMEEAADNLAGVFGSAFERLAETGRLTFRSFIKDLNQLIIRSTSELLQQELSKLFATMATSQGGLGSTLSNVFSGVFGGGNFFGGGRARGGVEMPWRNFIAGEEGAELIKQDGPAGARRVTTAGQTRHMMQQQGSSGPPITIIIQTPDVESFRKSQGQIAARMGNFISRGQRNQ